MSFRNTVQDWLAAVGDPAGVDLALNEAGAAGITLASGLTVTIEVEESGMLHLHSGLLRLPPDASRGLLLEEALALNLFTRGTEGATLGLDRKSDTLVLSVARDIASLTRDDFASLLAAFAETAEKLQGRLQGFRAQPGAVAAPSNERIDPRLLV